MNQPNPATPPQGATPGSDANVVTTPSSTTPANGGQGTEGKVTIDLKEYRDLQRAKARTLSFDKRVNLGKNKTTPNQPANGDGNNGGDPQILEQLSAAQQGQSEAERRALKAEVTGRVRDLLEKDEFKVLPKSTRALILKNPSMLSDADNVEEALLDIEDFIRDQVLTLDPAPQPVGGQQKGGTGSSQPGPTGHETPPAIGAGGSAPIPSSGGEDVSKLHGAAKSQAMIRNALKAQKGK